MDDELLEKKGLELRRRRGLEKSFAMARRLKKWPVPGGLLKRVLEMEMHHCRPSHWLTKSIRPFPSPIASTRLCFSSSASSSSSPKLRQLRRPYTTVLIVPTGVGAAIGGFAGDALPVARTMASVVDCLISHPNVLNAAMLYWPIPNALYVEGYALDRFAEGSWALRQVADAMRASLGLPVMEYVVTDSPLQVEKWIDPISGQSTGRIEHPDSLLRAVQSLVNHAQVDAVAVVGRFPDDEVDDLDDYRQGKGVDSLAGVEAIISHLVVKEFQIPCAHAPAMLPPPLTSSLAPRSAAEEVQNSFLQTLLLFSCLCFSANYEDIERQVFFIQDQLHWYSIALFQQIGYTFLPCVLAGLSTAPQYVVRKQGSLDDGCVLATDVDSVVLPINACGGDGALAFARRLKNKPLVIAVHENETVLDDTPEKLGIEALQVSNYWEAIGVMAAHKAGIDPKSLRRGGINNINRLSSPSSNVSKTSLTFQSQHQIHQS